MQMANKDKLNPLVECLDFDDEEEGGFIEGDALAENVLSSFSFISEPEPTPAGAPTNARAFEFNVSNPSAEILIDNRKIKTEANTATPAIEGEAYTISRFYKLRYSTAKMLNEIKAAHPDVNVYMNTIVDEAIRYYYSFLFEKEKNKLTVTPASLL
jgi:hypothetical protein